MHGSEQAEVYILVVPCMSLLQGVLWWTMPAALIAVWELSGVCMTAALHRDSWRQQRSNQGSTASQLPNV